MKQFLMLLCLCVLSACSSMATERAPSSDYLAPAAWMKELGIQPLYTSSIERAVGTRKGVYVIVEPGLAQARVGNKVVTLNKEARLWRGQIYVPRSSIAIMRKAFGSVPTVKEPPQPQWIPPVSEHAWKYIVIHHSHTTSGSASAFHRYHVEVRGWDELGYHFVIGNGTGSGDGVVEVGSRWTKQKHGAHAKTPSQKYNRHGIGICLVGNFSDGVQPTAAQMKSVIKLVKYFQKRYNISSDRVVRHKDVGNTECPGESFPWMKLKKSIY